MRLWFVFLDDDFRNGGRFAVLLHVLGDFVRQANRKAVFVQRPVIPGKIHNMNRGRFLQGAAILAVLIVYIRDTVPIANVACLLYTSPSPRD